MNPFCGVYFNDQCIIRSYIRKTKFVNRIPCFLAYYYYSKNLRNMHIVVEKRNCSFFSVKKLLICISIFNIYVGTQFLNKWILFLDGHNKLKNIEVVNAM